MTRAPLAQISAFIVHQAAPDRVSTTTTSITAAAIRFRALANRAAESSSSVSESAPDQPPLARDDQLPAARPGEHVSVDVLANDSDPEGLPLNIAVGDDATTMGVTVVRSGERRQLELTVGDASLVFSYAVSLKLFREKLSRRELAGMGLLAVGVVLISLKGASS